jgi:hypothetical protein
MELLPKEMKDISERVGGLVRFDNIMTGDVKIEPYNRNTPFTDDEKNIIRACFELRGFSGKIVFD